MPEIKNIDEEKQKLIELYEQWRHLNQNEKETSDLLEDFETLAEAIENKDFSFVSNYRIRIAYTFFNIGSIEISEKYFLQVLEKKDHLTNDNDILVNTLEGLGDLYFENKQYDKATVIYVNLLEISEISIFTEEDLIQIGISFLKDTKNIKKAEEILTEAYKLSDEEMDHLLATKSSYYLGLTKYVLGKYTESKPYLEKALIRYKRYNWDCKEILRMLNNIEDSNDSKPLSA